MTIRRQQQLLWNPGRWSQVRQWGEQVVRSVSHDGSTHPHRNLWNPDALIMQGRMHFTTEASGFFDLARHAHRCITSLAPLFPERRLTTLVQHHTAERPTPPPGDKQPRDSAYWAHHTATLKMARAPPGVINLHAEGRQAMSSLQSFGQLWRKPFCIRFTGLSVKPPQVIETWKEHFGAFWPTIRLRRVGLAILLSCPWCHQCLY